MSEKSGGTRRCPDSRRLPRSAYLWSTWPPLDAKRVLGSANNGTTWLLFDSVSGEAGYRRWETLHVDLPGCGNVSLLVRFEFDAVTNLSNDHRGWFVDDVRVFDDPDADNLSRFDEMLAGADPWDADTDDDDAGDADDRRPAVEDVPPSWDYLGEEAIGEVTFYTLGFVDVDMRPPTDNVGVDGVDFSLRLDGDVAGESVNATVRLDLRLDADTGHYVGRFPLPENLAGGRATGAALVLTARDVNGNKVGYDGTALLRLPMEYRVPWANDSHEEFAHLRLADLANATAGQDAFAYERFEIRATRAALGEQTLRGGLAGPVTSEAPITPMITGALVDAGTGTSTREDVLAFGDGFFNKIWTGVKTTYTHVIQPEVHSFVYGSDSNGRILGDVIAGLVIYGDVRDV